jgi:hypothetical protein
VHPTCIVSIVIINISSVQLGFSLHSNSLQPHVHAQLQYLPTHCSGVGAILRSSSQLIGERRAHRLAAVALPLGSRLLARQAHSCHLCRSTATALASASAPTLQHHTHTGSLQVHLSLPSARASCRAQAHITILRLALCISSIAGSALSDHTQHVLARNACSGKADSLSSGAE